MFRVALLSLATSTLLLSSSCSDFVLSKIEKENVTYMLGAMSEGCTRSDLIAGGATSIWAYDPQKNNYTMDDAIPFGTAFWIKTSKIPDTTFPIPPMPEEGECNQNVMNKIEAVDTWHMLVATGLGCSVHKLEILGANRVFVFDNSIGEYSEKNDIPMGGAFWIISSKTYPDGGSSSSSSGGGGTSSSSSSSSSSTSSSSSSSSSSSWSDGNPIRRWIAPSESECNSGGGVYQVKNAYSGGDTYVIPYCYGTWSEAIDTCESMGARLPNVNELSEVITSCGGNVMAFKEYNSVIASLNSNNSNYQKCILESGFYGYSLYWSSTPESIKGGIYSMYFHSGYINTYYKTSEKYFICTK